MWEGVSVSANASFTQNLSLEEASGCVGIVEIDHGSVRLVSRYLCLWCVNFARCVNFQTGAHAEEGDEVLIAQLSKWSTQRLRVCSLRFPFDLKLTDMYHVRSMATYELSELAAPPRLFTKVSY